MSEERNCVNCIHWRWHSGQGGYSDLTPGTDWSSHCSRGHWEMEGDGVSDDQFRDNMRWARRCSDYSERVTVYPTVNDFGFSRQILVRRGTTWSVMNWVDCSKESFSDVDEWKRVGP